MAATAVSGLQFDAQLKTVCVVTGTWFSKSAKPYALGQDDGAVPNDADGDADELLSLHLRFDGLIDGGHRPFRERLGPCAAAAAAIRLRRRISRDIQKEQTTSGS